MELRELGSGLKIGDPVPGQKVLDPVMRVIGDAGQHFAQPAFSFFTCYRIPNLQKGTMGDDDDGR